jgi:hypothetical protein
MFSNCYKKIDGGHLVGEHSMEDLKSDLHMTHYKWQKYGLSLKKQVDYQAAFARTFEVSEQIKSSVLEMIPKDLLDIEVPHIWYLEVTGTDDDKTMVPPHIDSFRICTINYYLKANGETTHYYKYVSGDIEEIDSFCAKTNECWILNTTIPHSVKLLAGETRSVIGVSFIDTPFERVISFFP